MAGDIFAIDYSVFVGGQRPGHGVLAVGKLCVMGIENYPELEFHNQMGSEVSISSGEHEVGHGKASGNWFTRVFTGVLSMEITDNAGAKVVTVESEPSMVHHDYRLLGPDGVELPRVHARWLAFACQISVEAGEAFDGDDIELQGDVIGRNYEILINGTQAAQVRDRTEGIVPKMVRDFRYTVTLSAQSNARQRALVCGLCVAVDVIREKRHRRRTSSA